MFPEQSTDNVQSRKTVVEAAKSVLRYQCQLDEESQPGGRCDVQWINSSFVNHEFLLATSAICFYVQYFLGQIDQIELAEIQALCQQTEAIWCRHRNSSAESLKASEVLRVMLMRLDTAVSLNQTSVGMSEQSPSDLSYQDGEFLETSS